MKEVLIRKVHINAVIPEYQSSGAAGFDFHLIDDVTIQPGEMIPIQTGLAMQIPAGHVLIVASRASSPIKKGVNLANSIGVIDEDFCGNDDEIFIVVQNLRTEAVHLKKGDRIAQGVILPVTHATFKEVSYLEQDNRGGHGSTGM
ncbi:MAG: dUTP diphosphatase [bacterium]|nr:dUTP diphosphatase [bacterium]MDA1024457.1 dUTP diphosphatase [bacterium]